MQPQAVPGSCHAIGTGLYSRPDPACTPGALNPVVTQATIDRTICVDGWTGTMRPSESITEQEKTASMAAYGDTGSPSGYEYDHFVPLELGGATNDPRNLWPEPGASPNPKDAVEDELRHEVCDDQISLAEAQLEIVTNWVSLASPSSAPTATAPPPTLAPARGAECTLTDSYSSNYSDYDVYVHSNQPDQTVIVSDTEGHTDSWHTDAFGYADVYFKSGGYAAGRRIIARVGQASCSTTLRTAYLLGDRPARRRSRRRPWGLRSAAARSKIVTASRAYWSMSNVGSASMPPGSRSPSHSDRGQFGNRRRSGSA
ncbi:MAG: hypothetical protein ACLP8S_14845 [Solirubrobacteraceae bacterium]